MHLFIPIFFIFISILGAYLIYYRNDSYDESKSSFTKWLSFNPKEGLASQPLLWLCILIPILQFFSFGVFAWSGYSLDFTASGFNTFIEISKLPLGILALSLPFSALAIRIHTTHQTALNIKVTEFKNKQDAYYSHEKALHDSFARIPKMKVLGFYKGYEFPVDNRLYKKIYPKNNPRDGVNDYSQSFLSELDKKLTELGILIYYINTYSAKVEDITPIANLLKGSYSCINQLCYQLYIDVPSEEDSTISLRIEDSSIFMHSKNIDQLVGQFRYLWAYLLNLYAFTGFESQNIDSRLNHIIQHPMYLMIKKKDVVADLYENHSNRVFDKIDFQIPPD